MGPTVGGYLGAAGDLYRGARLAVGVSLLSALLHALCSLLPGSCFLNLAFWALLLQVGPQHLLHFGDDTDHTGQVIVVPGWPYTVQP